jgi:S-DNA-T family DNA segregation ATPase FtsK/SpoIIIE
VLDRPDAAHISRRTPGRAWVRRTGHGTDELTQIAWVGARAPVIAAAAAVEIAPFSAHLSASTGLGTPVHQRTDLERLVTTIGEAFVRSGRAAPTRPWLPPLPTELPMGASRSEPQGTPGRAVLYLGAAALDAEYAPGATSDVVRAVGAPGQVPVGLLDQPGRRAQPPLMLDYAQVGHVLVYGASGSGKTELLRTTAVAATLGSSEPVPCLYAIDFGGGGLLTLADWPAVGSVVGEQDINRVLRLIRMLRHTVTERNQALARAGAPDLAALAAKGQPLRRIHVLVDNLPALVEALEAKPVRQVHADLLASVLVDGRRVGVHFTATTARRTGVPTAMQAAFGERLVLRMTTDDDYTMLGVPGGVVTADSPPGRGLLGRNEFQIATVSGQATAPAQRLARLAAKLGDPAPLRATPVPAMPARVPFTALPQPRRDQVAIGVDSEFVDPVTLSLVETPLVVAGRARSGRTSMLAGLAGLARRSDEPPSEVILLGPRVQETGGVDRVLTAPADVVAWLAEPPADPAGWRLVLVDDAHLWEREWESGGVVREAVAGLARAVDAAAELRLGFVVATDIDEARSRQHVPGVVTAARRGRRGVLLQPDFADGSLFSVMIPGQTVEPLTGVGRGIYCVEGSMHVIQVVGLPEGGVRESVHS